MQIYLALAIPVLIITAWLYTARVTHASFSQIRGKRICLLIAHPDDEAMFFSPTLLALTSVELGNHVKILCLSTGIPSYVRLIHYIEKLTLLQGMPTILEQLEKRS